jgi:hypothetical protein
MPKIDLNTVKTDDTADSIYDKLQEELEVLMAQDRTLENELLMRATNDGDLRMLVAVYTDRVAEKENRLKDGSGLVLASAANSKGVGATPKGSTNDDNPVALRFGLDWLAEHSAIVEEAEKSFDTVKRLRHAGVPFQQLVMGLLDAIEQDPRKFVVDTSGHLVPTQWVTDQKYQDRLQTAFNSVLLELSLDITGDPAHRASQARDAIQKLRALPAAPVTTEAEELYKLVTSKLAHDPKKESVADYLKRIQASLNNQGVTQFLDACGNDPKVNVKRKSSESNEDYLARLMLAGAVGNSNELTVLLSELGNKIGVPGANGESFDDFKGRIIAKLAILENYSDDYKKLWDELVKIVTAHGMDLGVKPTPNGFAMLAFLNDLIVQHLNDLEAARQVVMNNGVPAENTSTAAKMVNNLIRVVNSDIQAHNDNLGGIKVNNRHPLNLLVLPTV